LALEPLQGERYAAGVGDIRRQLDRLVAPGFLANTPWAWLKQYGRYLQAVEIRIERLRGGEVARDRQQLDEVLPWESLGERRALELGPLAELDVELTQFRWMVEEFRVSLFAQRLGTLLPVSAKRLERQWQIVEQASAVS
jgi:ATP-dependent helicase HrpA